MRLSVASSAVAAAFALTPVAAGYTPAWCQDFSITNEVAPPIAGHPDLMRQLQAWWDAHAFYPRHASNNDEGGTVKVHLVILPDGRIWTIDVIGSSGSHSLDTAASSVFRGGSVRPFPAGETQADVDISLHYVLAHRHGQPVAAGYTPVVSKGPFTITNNPDKSPILETMLQRTCTGTLVFNGIPNHPSYGMHSSAEAIFFRKPDGTPWVKLSERGFNGLSPVTEVGKMLTWTGRMETIPGNGGGQYRWHQYTVWPDGDNHLKGAIALLYSRTGDAYIANGGGDTVDLTCATQILPTITWNDSLAENEGGVTSSLDPP